MRYASFVLLLIFISVVSNGFAEDWPGWRGPRGDGTSSEKNIPTIWNGKTDEGIAWKVPIPGYGHSSPIVQGDHIYVGTCLEKSDERVLLCLNRADGKELWRQSVIEAPLEKKHKLNSFASGTPVTDGKIVVISFLDPEFHSTTKRTPGEMVVAAFDTDGKPQWKVRPGKFASTHGFCSSPVLFENLVIVNGDHDGDSYIVALDRETGDEVWKVARKHKTRSYVTPIIREIDGRTQMILSGSKCISSYDPRTGERHWVIDGPTEQFVASLVYNGDLLFMTAGFPERHILAINPVGTGNVTDSHIVWRTTKSTSYVPSPIVVDKYFLVAADNGVASCYEAASGELQWMERLGKHYSASLVTAGGLVYFLADDGIVKVVRPGPELDVVAENPLGEYCFASPAISEGRIYIRSEEHLWCIGK